MRPCENVLVTVKLDADQIDMELPAFLRIEELINKLLETLRVMRPEKYFAYSSLDLIFENQMLDLERNLASYGIWDGSIISCRFRE